MAPRQTSNVQRDAAGTLRCAYTVEFKRHVCRLRATNPAISQAQLASLVDINLGVKLTASTLSCILSGQARWEAAPSLRAHRIRASEFPEIEVPLRAWCQQWLDNNGCITYHLLQEKALKIAQELNLSEELFKASNGWAQRFCHRHGLRVRRKRGEAGDADDAAAELARNVLPLLLGELQVEPNNIYNCDETGIKFAAQPDRTLSFEKLPGVKANKDRVTLLLCCNATGSDLRKPLLITTAARPRDFGKKGAPGSFEPEAFCHYYANASAWMTRDIFSTWLLRLNEDVRAEGRRIVLWLDNCSSHVPLFGCERLQFHGLEVFRMTDMDLVFLPANCTALVQPLDQGIISMVKARYRRWFLHWILNKVDEEPALLSRVSRMKPAMRESIVQVTSIWHSIEPRMIQNCWAKARILPAAWGIGRAADCHLPYERELEAISGLIAGFPLEEGDRMTAAEYVGPLHGEERHPELSVHELIETASPEEDQEATPDGAQEVEDGSPSVNAQQAAQMLRGALDFFSGQAGSLGVQPAIQLSGLLERLMNSEQHGPSGNESGPQ